MTELKKALQEKIKQFEAFKTDPMYQTQIEQNAVQVTLRELKYLDSIAEFTIVKQKEKKNFYSFRAGNALKLLIHTSIEVEEFSKWYPNVKIEKDDELDFLKNADKCMECNMWHYIHEFTSYSLGAVICNHCDH